MLSIEKNTDAIAQINIIIKERKEYLLDRINANERNLIALKEIQKRK